jgi:hypothetical protein
VFASIRRHLRSVGTLEQNKPDAVQRIGVAGSESSIRLREGMAAGRAEMKNTTCQQLENCVELSAELLYSLFL